MGIENEIAQLTSLLTEAIDEAVQYGDDRAPSVGLKQSAKPLLYVGPVHTLKDLIAAIRATIAKLEVMLADERKAMENATLADEENGRYSGRVMKVDGNFIYQDMGRNEVVKHKVEKMNADLPVVDQKWNIEYHGGQVKARRQLTVKGRGLGR